MRIIFILTLIFLSKASWSFTDYKYLIFEIDSPKKESISINDSFISKHNCSMTNIAGYQKKIFNNISKLKEIWKNNYKDNKM